MAILLMALFSACKKNKTETAPAPSAEYSRTLIFPNQNNLVKAQAYTTKDRLEISAAFSEGRLGLMFLTPAKTDGSKGESIYLQLDVATASSALVRSYSPTGNNGGISNVRFAYTERNNAGDIWGSITEKAIGTIFSGSFSITKYDATHRTISGLYHIEANGLINDPTVHSVASPIDPRNSCNLMVMGSFENVQID
jgi:hypothetical protein